MQDSPETEERAKHSGWGSVAFNGQPITGMLRPFCSVWLGNPVSLLILSLGIWGMPLTALAHGVKIETKTTPSMEIQAAYDSGEPMADASITIYAPNDPATPWRQGNTDANGRFIFAPDLSLPGKWDIKVRKAGHGGIVHVTVDEPKAGVGWVEERNPTQGTAPEQSLSPLQKGVMLASVVWGCVGTALFFSRPKIEKNPGF